MQGGKGGFSPAAPLPWAWAAKAHRFHKEPVAPTTPPRLSGGGPPPRRHPFRHLAPPSPPGFLLHSAAPFLARLPQSGTLMPTVEHDALAELFRFQPALAVALLRDVLGLDLPPHTSFDLPETDLSQTMTTEYRADGVVLLRDHAGDPVLGVVVEIQRAIDERKRWSWPVYAGALRARWRCPVALLVLCLDDETAAWAQQPIDLGFGQEVRPFAVGPRALPRIREAEQASKLPELAVLSAMTHGNDEPDGLETVLATMVALARFDEERARFYLDLILARMNERVRRALEAMRMQKYEYQSEFARKYYGQGKQEGFAEGLHLGKAEGKAEGEAKGKAEIGRAHV